MPGLVAGLRLEQFALEAAALGPAQVHAQDHLGPVLRLGAARARVHGDDRVLGVVLAAEHLLDLAGLDFDLQLVEPAHEVAADVLAGVEPLAQDDQVVGALAQRLQQRDVFVEAPAPLQHLLRRGLVVPEVGRAGLRLEAREFLLGASGVKDTSRVRQRAAAGPRIACRPLPSRTPQSTPSQRLACLAVLRTKCRMPNAQCRHRPACLGMRRHSRIPHCRIRHHACRTADVPSTATRAAPP